MRIVAYVTSPLNNDMLCGLGVSSLVRYFYAIFALIPLTIRASVGVVSSSRTKVVKGAVN